MWITAWTRACRCWRWHCRDEQHYQHGTGAPARVHEGQKPGKDMGNTVNDTALPASWREWILRNRLRGATESAMLAAMQEARVETALAISWLASSASDQPPAQPGARPYSYESSRIGAGNMLVLPDATVRVALRLHKPDIVLLEDFLSPDECAVLIAEAQQQLQPSTVVDPQSGDFRSIAERSSEGAQFTRGASPLLRRIEERIAALTGWPLENGEGIQVLHYRQGAEYRPHFDYFPPENPGSTVHLRNGGQRVATLVMYLNEVAAGGATIFPAVGLNIAPRPGSAVYFSYCNAKAQLDPATLHGGAPVLAGEKWIATKWLRQQAHV